MYLRKTPVFGGVDFLLSRTFWGGRAGRDSTAMPLELKASR
jgi:hypothetical protein